MVLIKDDANDGAVAKEELGTIVVRIHRVKVLGPWEGKLTPLAAKQHKPVLVSEKAGGVYVDHRVGFVSSYLVIDCRFSLPTSMKGTVKPQTTEWIDDRTGAPFAEFKFHYRSQGEDGRVVNANCRQTKRIRVDTRRGKGGTIRVQ